MVNNSFFGEEHAFTTYLNITGKLYFSSKQNKCKYHILIQTNQKISIGRLLKPAIQMLFHICSKNILLDCIITVQNFPLIRT